MNAIDLHAHVLVAELADPALAPFFARAAELSAVVFVHPLGCTMGDRLAAERISAPALR